MYSLTYIRRNIWSQRADDDQDHQHSKDDINGSS